MHTPAIPCLPRPPNIMRARCAEALYRDYPTVNWLNFLSDYLWRFNFRLNYFLPNIFYDLRYGSCLFPDKTLDCGEMKYDADEFTICICGTEYTHSIGVYTLTFLRETISPELIRRKGTGASCAASWADYSNSPTYTAEDSPSSVYNLVQLRQLSLGGERARSLKEYLKFDTSTADPDPTSATLRLRITTFDKSAGLDDPTLQVYSQDWGDEVDVDDRTGGSLVASEVISEAGAVEFDVGVDSVNVGGDSKYRVTLKEIEDGTTIGCNEHFSLFISQYYGETERLTLGYGA